MLPNSSIRIPSLMRMGLVSRVEGALCAEPTLTGDPVRHDVDRDRKIGMTSETKPSAPTIVGCRGGV